MLGSGIANAGGQIGGAVGNYFANRPSVTGGANDFGYVPSDVSMNPWEMPGANAGVSYPAPYPAPAIPAQGNVMWAGAPGPYNFWGYQP